MIINLWNGNYVRAADVRSIRVEELPGDDNSGGHVPRGAAVIRHGDTMDVQVETIHFPSKDDAQAYADDIAGLASAAMVEEANRTIERDTRRERDRFLDRVAVIASGLLSVDPMGVSRADRIVEIAARTAARIQGLEQE